MPKPSVIESIHKFTLYWDTYHVRIWYEQSEVMESYPFTRQQLSERLEALAITLGSAIGVKTLSEAILTWAGVNAVEVMEGSHGVVLYKDWP